MNRVDFGSKMSLAFYPLSLAPSPFPLIHLFTLISSLFFVDVFCVFCLFVCGFSMAWVSYDLHKTQTVCLLFGVFFIPLPSHAAHRRHFRLQICRHWFPFWFSSQLRVVSITSLTYPIPKYLCPMSMPSPLPSPQLYLTEGNVCVCELGESWESMKHALDC